MFGGDVKRLDDRCLFWETQADRLPNGRVVALIQKKVPDRAGSPVAGAVGIHEWPG
jgi:hypothetical protein